MCETRWVDRYESVIRFKELYKALKFKRVFKFRYISRTTCQLSNAISNSVFIIALYDFSL